MRHTESPVGGVYGDMSPYTSYASGKKAAAIPFQGSPVLSPESSLESSPEVRRYSRELAT